MKNWDKIAKKNLKDFRSILRKTLGVKRLPKLIMVQYGPARSTK